MDARAISLNILRNIYIDKAYANLALNQGLKKYTPLDQERRFITELVYGVVKTGDSLLWLMKKYLKKPIHKLDPLVVIILRMGLYQLKYMDSVPPSAACNESVKLAKQFVNPGAGNFVNGVLRSYLRQPADFPPGNTAQAVALREFHPLWLVKKFIHTFGSEQALQLCAFNNTKADLNLRVNTLKTTRPAMMEKLLAEGYKAEISQKAPEGIILTEHKGLTNLKLWQEGFLQVQDEASMMVAHVVNPKPGDKVLDLCAAPGGKTTHLAQLMNNTGEIYAGDIHEHKLALIEDNAQRLGLSIIKTKTWDAAKIHEQFGQEFDKVLVDAPCSGMGVLRKKIDARWEKTPAIFEVLPPLQRAILASAAKTVKVGGTLVYSTCTIFPEENEMVIKDFLATNPNYQLENAFTYLPYKKQYQKGQKMINFFPPTDHTDGFFIARLKRVN